MAEPAESIYVTEDVIRTQKRDTLMVGEYAFETDALIWQSCAKVNRGPEAHGYVVRVRAQVTKQVANAFFALLRDHNAPLDGMTRDNLIDLCLLAEALGCAQLAERLIGAMQAFTSDKP